MVNVETFLEMERSAWFSSNKWVFLTLQQNSFIYSFKVNQHNAPDACVAVDPISDCALRACTCRSVPNQRNSCRIWQTSFCFIGYVRKILVYITINFISLISCFKAIPADQSRISSTISVLRQLVDLYSFTDILKADLAPWHMNVRCESFCDN